MHRPVVIVWRVRKYPASGLTIAAIQNGKFPASLNLLWQHAEMIGISALLPI